MKNFLLVSTFLIGGITAAVISMAAVFFASFYTLRFVCWVAKNDQYMFYMWFTLPLGPLAACSAFVVGGILAFACLKRRLDPSEAPGFAVMPPANVQLADGRPSTR